MKKRKQEYKIINNLTFFYNYFGNKLDLNEILIDF